MHDRLPAHFTSDIKLLWTVTFYIEGQKEMDRFSDLSFRPSHKCQMLLVEPHEEPSLPANILYAGRPRTFD